MERGKDDARREGPDGYSRGDATGATRATSLEEDFDLGDGGSRGSASRVPANPRSPRPDGADGRAGASPVFMRTGRFLCAVSGDARIFAECRRGAVMMNAPPTASSGTSTPRPASTRNRSEARPTAMSLTAGPKGSAGTTSMPTRHRAGGTFLRHLDVSDHFAIVGRIALFSIAELQVTSC